MDPEFFSESTLFMHDYPVSKCNRLYKEDAVIIIYSSTG
jgi:hypothetical protein